MHLYYFKSNLIYILIYHIINIYVYKLYNYKKFFYKIYKIILDYNMYNTYKK